ncbi:helix-turn-helix domain-containing protein [Halodesulfurarchaeum sp.]|uniref:helix-turn-helix domain-containing protein n=1 Tax=Halodesulfurarchaeum sp. TaxID=1980530 RepID=UPI002FC39445
MPGVELTIEMPKDSWIGQITDSFSETDFRVLTILVNEGSGHAVLEVETTEPSAVLGSLQSRTELETVDLLSVDSTRGVFQIETRETSILEPFLAAGVPLETPIHITRGIATWEFTTSQDRLSNLSTHLQHSGLAYTVDRIGTGEPETANRPGLTARQEEVFEAAHRAGYFEIPREATVRDVAERTSVNKSTASETLRRAVRNLVEWYDPAET